MPGLSVVGAAGTMLLLAAAFISDIRTMTIPNRLTLPALAAGLIYHMLPAPLQGAGLPFAIWGGAAGFALMYLLFLFKAVGAGDVKLFAALGAWIGAADILHTAMYALLFAGVYGLVLLVLRRRRAAELRTAKFPFMIAVVPAAAAVWVI